MIEKLDIALVRGQLYVCLIDELLRDDLEWSLAGVFKPSS